MKRVISYLFIFLLISACSLFEDDSEIKENAPAEFVLTENNEYPLLGLEEDGTSYLFSKDMTNIYIRRDNGDEWSLNIDPTTGKPSDLYMVTSAGNFFIIFSNFNGDLADIAVSTITGISRVPGSNADNGDITSAIVETQYFLGIPFEGISNAEPMALLKSAENTTEDWDAWMNDYGWPTLKRTVAHSAGALGCGIVLVNDVIIELATVGAATPFALAMTGIACGAWGTGLAADILGISLFSDISFTSAISGSSIDCGKAITTKNPTDIFGCINDLIGLAAGISTDGNGMKNVVGNNISGELQLYMNTGGLIGNWKSDDEPQTYTSSSNGYTFSSTVNPLEMQFATTVCNVIISGTQSVSGPDGSDNVDFSYAFKYNFSLVDKVKYDIKENDFFCEVDFQIQGVTLTGYGSSTYFSWSEFTSAMTEPGVNLPVDNFSEMDYFVSKCRMSSVDQSLRIDLFNGDEAVLYRQ